jgi:hypothetical protein
LGAAFTATEIHLWESHDGLAWNEVDLPSLHEGPIRHVMLAGGDDRLFLVVFENDETVTMWTSTDGRAWQVVNVDPDTIFTLESTDFGYLMTSFDSVAMSSDGVAWEQLALPGEPAEPALSYFDGVFFMQPETFFVPPADGFYTAWVGRFAD